MKDEQKEQEVFGQYRKLSKRRKRKCRIPGVSGNRGLREVGVHV